MKDIQRRKLLHRNFKLKFGIILTPVHLDEIAIMYYLDQKDIILRVGMYRFINFTIGLMFVGVSWFLKDTLIEDGIHFLLWIVFVVYNFIHGFKNWIEYKRLKKFKALSELEAEDDAV